MPSRLAAISCLAVLLALAGCQRAENPDGLRGRVLEATAELRPLEGRTARGAVDLMPVGGGLAIEGAVTGLRGRTHAYRVHQFGDCSDPRGRSAGPEFAFTDPSSGAAVDGTLLETSSDDTGEVRLAGRFGGGRLVGPLSVLGRSVVVHRIDRATDGSIVDTRIACGVIGIAREARD